ncbi:MAG: ATP-binding cassette domain-containing protein, partial [Anaerolineaceae bacterium]|nr:ATP-binding cassette domain-containing protein [Anaerolineaceae bacterium]
LPAPASRAGGIIASIQSTGGGQTSGRLDGQPQIEVQQLGHVYMAGTPLSHRALVDVSLTVADHGAHGLVGSTGSGKSTLLQHLNGLLRPQEGRVRVGKYDLAQKETDVRLVRRMAGLVFQLPELQLFEQYVGDEVAYGQRLIGVRETLREDVRWAMETAGLNFDTFKDRLSFQLSGGERRKVALASILALKPLILLLDEPTAGLDPASRRELLTNLERLHTGGMTLVVSSHQMGDVAALVDSVTVLNEGRDIVTGSTADIFSQTERLKTLGMEPPLVTLVAEGLRGLGWQIPAGITSGDVLVQQLECVMAGVG